jgi:MFS family permease
MLKKLDLWLPTQRPLDFSVNVAFPAITNAFSLPTQSIRWIPFSYVVTYGLLVIGFGALGDRLGHLHIFRAGLVLAIFALSMFALAPNYHLLIAARILQGISAAILLSCAPAIVPLALLFNSLPFHFHC